MRKKTIQFKTKKPSLKNLSISRIADTYGFNRITLYERVKKNPNELIENLLYKSGSKSVPLYTYKGESLSARQWSDKLGVQLFAMKWRLANMPLKRAIELKRKEKNVGKKQGFKDNDVIEDFDKDLELERRVKRWLSEGMSEEEIIMKMRH